MTVRTNYILIDYENVQPTDLAMLRDGPFNLIRHLKAKGVSAQRSTSISAIPYFKPALPSTSDAQVDVVVAHLSKLKAAKPRAEKTLRGTLHALYKKELSESQLSALFALLCKQGIVKVEGTKVSYVLPSEQPGR